MGRVLVLIYIGLINIAICGSVAGARDLDKAFEKTKFRIGKKDLTAYVADDDRKRADGLMYVTKLPVDTGMLFIFEEEQPLGFWMKNTLIPLSIGFFNEKGTLVDVQEMKIAESIMSTEIPSYRSRAPAIFALEMETGWFKKHKIDLGAKIELRATTKSALLKKMLPPRH